MRHLKCNLESKVGPNRCANASLLNFLNCFYSKTSLVRASWVGIVLVFEPFREELLEIFSQFLVHFSETQIPERKANFWMENESIYLIQDSVSIC
ncbi:hypothetical protein CEXT_422721 [Caerostris extrusa]|uniref:Uncharacterized protein n=1 Tax=Caerostris extrusa TaxID=172846 RepID=A0AAV4XZI6_CAEEX|nr:hypothetical protein CEXT_422721 [Caerostris extrusa]